MNTLKIAKRNLGNKSSLLRLTTLFILLIAFIFCHSKETGYISLKPNHNIQLNKAFDKWQIIGEGSCFLTIKIDCPEKLISELQIFTLILDKDMFPLRKVTGYTHDPKLKKKSHLWFYFFLYRPGQRSPYFQSKSEYIKFICMKDNNAVFEKVIEYQKAWEGNEKIEIYDLPSPPDKIPGYLLLKDYTFLARGDYRKPKGYFVEGKAAGNKGQWTHFITLSNVLGEESESENIISIDQGWLELSTGRTHSMVEAIAPTPPYVKGWWDGKGYFHPNPARVYGLKLKFF